MATCPICGSEANGQTCPFCGASLGGPEAAPISLKSAPRPTSQPVAKSPRSRGGVGGYELNPGFFKAYPTCWKKFCVFNGRASGAEFWGFTTFHILILFALFLLVAFTSMDDAVKNKSYNSSVPGVSNPIGESKPPTPRENAQSQTNPATAGLMMLYMIVSFLPSLGVTVRRLHDTGRSGAFVLVSIIPTVGQLILVLMLVGASTPGPNQYGPQPRR